MCLAVVREGEHGQRHAVRRFGRYGGVVSKPLRHHSHRISGCESQALGRHVEIPGCDQRNRQAEGKRGQHPAHRALVDAHRRQQGGGDLQDDPGGNDVADCHPDNVSANEFAV